MGWWTIYVCWYVAFYNITKDVPTYSYAIQLINIKYRDAY